MQTKSLTIDGFKTAIILLLGFQLLSCKKAGRPDAQPPLLNIENSVASKVNSSGAAQFNLEAVLRGEGSRGGHIHFRQDPDATKIINLDTKVHHLKPNHAYMLQRAVDAINVVDGQCTSSSWLSLGYGTMTHAIMTDDKGNGQDILWRNVSAVPSGSTFDIHFRVIDNMTKVVVLTSDCYQYKVR